MFQIVISNKCKKDLKRTKERGLSLDEFFVVVDMLQRQGVLPARYRNHALATDRVGLRDRHIQPGWVLIYGVREAELMLFLVEIGSHSDLRM